ncbi:MAG: helix-turn-helix transcriptional regulator [Clostridia bacterium]|nr:helix-turn-helix transcriptional regulator [Clostridia bacterium]
MRFYQLKNYVDQGIVSAVVNRWNAGVINYVHSHDCYEIDYIIKGAGDYNFNGTAYPIRPGTLFFNSPVDVHNMAIREYTEFITVMFPCAVFEPELLVSSFAPDIDPMLSVPEAERGLLEGMLLEVVKRAEPDRENALHFLRCVLLKVFELVPKKDHHPDSHVQAAIVYILENFRFGITQEDTAAHVGLTPVYLSALFRRELGQSFKNYVDHLRFTHAAHMLRHTDLPVLEICTLSGFNDYANFSRRFRQRYGVSPSNLRK